MPEIDLKKLEDKNGPMKESDIQLSDYKLDQKKEVENYYMKLRIGPHKEPIKVSIDTEGRELFVKTDQCASCTGAGIYDAFSDDEDDMSFLPNSETSPPDITER